MKKFYFFWKVLGCCLVLRLGAVWAEGVLSAEQLEAEAIIDSYCKALISGDVNEIKSLLGGEYLEQKRQLLKNPIYPDFLRERYSNAHCELVNNTLVDENRVEISVNITLNGGETLQSLFLLMKGNGTDGLNPKFQIHGEEID